MLASSIASFQNNNNDNNNNNKSNSTSFWRCFIEKSSSLLRSPYTSIAIAGCYYFGVPLLQHHYKRATSPSMKNTVILAHDAVLNMFLEEHNKNLRSAVISILLNREKHEKGDDDDEDDDDLNREKTAASSSPVSSSETDGSVPSILNFVKNGKTSSFVAVPIDLRINACLATLDEKQTEKCDDSGTTRKNIKLHDRGLENVSGVVRNITMSKRELFASSEGRKALRSLAQHPRATSTSFSSSSFSETNDNDNDDVDDEENDSDIIVVDEIRFPLFFALYDREKNNCNHLILSRDFLYKKNSLELAKLTIFALDSLALAKTTIRNSASTQPLEHHQQQHHQEYSILSSICKDFVSLYLACNLIGVKHYLFKEVNDQVEIRNKMSKHEGDTNKNLDWTNNFILNLIPRLCAPLRNNNKNNSDIHFADKPSLLRSCAMIQHICRQSFLTTTSKADCCDDHLRTFLERCNVLIPNVFSDNSDKECFSRCKTVPLFPFCEATSNLSRAATIFGNLYCEDDSSQSAVIIVSNSDSTLLSKSENEVFVSKSCRTLLQNSRNSSTSSSLKKITSSSSSSLSNFFSAVSNEISSLATNVSEDFIPLIHRSQLIKKAIRWVPMTALVLNVGLNFFFNTMSSIESSIDSKNSRVISSTDCNDNSGAPAVNLPIFAALRAFAVQSNWLQYALLEFISSFTKYTTDAKMARRWFLLSMTSDFENSTLSTNGHNNNKCENDEGGATTNRNHPNSSSSGGGRVDTSFFFADSTITGALERTCHILESVPGLLQKMQQIMFEPSVNLATTITLLFFTTSKQDDSKNQIPLTLLDSLSPAPSFTKLWQWFSQICLKKYLAPFLLFVLIKRIHGFAEQRGTIEGGILNFYSTWQKRITLRQSTRMKNMMKKLLSKQEAETILMLTLDPFVNTAHIFGNSSGIASFQGFDGFEQFDEENMNNHNSNNNNKIKKLKKETSRTNSENDIPQLHLDDGNDFDEEQQDDDDDDDTNNKANSNFQLENNMENFDYLDNDSEDNFFWYVPELERRQYSDRQDERRKRRRPTLGLAMLACAVRSDEEGTQKQEQEDNRKKKVLSYLLLEGESSRPSSHLLIRWPSSPLSVNLFFSPIIQEIHPKYLFPIHQKFSELLRKISSHLHRQSLEQQPDQKLQNLQNTAASPLQVPNSSTKTSTVISHLFFTGGGSSKPSLDTIKKIFETQRFRSVRSSGFEVDVASASAPFFVANTEGDLSNEHAFNINSYSRVTDFIASSSADMGDGLEDGILEILQRSDVGLLSQDSKEGLMVLSKKSCVRFGYGAGAAGGGTQPSYDEIAGSASMQILKAIDESPEFDTARQDAYGGVDQQMAVLEQLEQNEAELSKMKIMSKTASSSSSKTRPDDENCDDELEIRKMLHADLRRDRKIDQVVHFDEKSSPLFMRNLFAKSVTSFEWEFRDVSFAYPSTSTDSPPLVLKDISFTIPASVKSCGICGESGGGKSSILALMLKVYQPTKGEILLNGVNINDIPARWLRRHMAYVGPGSKLFKSQTARGQVLTANPLIENDFDATRALREACVPERMFSQRDQQQLMGNQTFPKAAMMSGGEQQRVQIARAFGKMVMSRKTAPSQENGVDDDEEDEEDEDVFSDDRVIALLFDEGTSALDAKTEEQIVKAIEDTGRSTSITRFMIAHRLFTIRDCDTILVIHNHRLIIKGKFFECARKAHRALEIAKEESKNEQQRKNATSSFSKHTLAGLKWFYDGVEKQTIKGEESAFLKLVQSPSNATDLNFADDEGSEFSNDQQVSASTSNTSGFASDIDEHE